MTNLAVKEVEFNGDTLITVKDNESGKVYVAVKWVCEGMKLSEGQMKSERKKIQEDIVLSKGGRNMNLPTKGGYQDIQCIELDFLPLWLAKISITPKMKKDSPVTVGKLIEYQLYAKEVLANAFVRNVSQIVPTTYKDALKSLIESIEKQEEVIQEQKYEIELHKAIVVDQTPKVESFDMFINAKNNQKMNDVAKSLGIGRNKLFALLRGKGILMSDNVPYQRYIDSKYFVVKEYSTMLNEGYIKNVTQTFVTAKGVEYIGKLLREDGNLKLNSLTYNN